MQSAKDIRVTGIKAVNTISVTSTAGSIVDDEVESTILDAKNVTLVANGNIGGANAITVADLQSQSGNFVGAIDVNIPVTGGKLTVTQLSAGGNVQVRDTAGALSLGSVDTSNLMAVVNWRLSVLIHCQSTRPQSSVTSTSCWLPRHRLQQYESIRT